MQSLAESNKSLGGSAGKLGDQVKELGSKLGINLPDGAKKALCGDIDDYCPAMVKRFQQAGRWHSTPQPGDLIFFKNALGVACHVGMVYKVAGDVYTIEGNTSSAAGVVANGGCVRTKQYPASHKAILGYGRPDYDKIT